MPRGPEHQRLANYVDNADPDSLDEAATQWRTGMELLRQVSKELDTKANGMRAAQSYSDGEIWSGETATTARDAFTMSSVAMHDKSNEMEKGANAFTDAATGIRNARQRLQQLDSRDPGALPTAPTISPGPRSHADEVAQSNYDTGVANWWKDYNDNETDATAAITTLQGNHTEQAVVFQSIHGETVDQPGATGGGGNPVSTGTRPTVGHVPTTLVNDHDLDNPTDPDHDPNDPGDGSDNPSGGGNTGPGDGSTDPGHGIHPSPGTGTGTGTGLPAGPTTTAPIGPLSTGPTTATGGSIGAVGGVGAVAGGALGGAVAAGLAGGLAGSLSGGLVPAGGRGGLSSSGVRGIGATSRGTGVGSVLGRGTGTGGRAGAGGVASRNGGRGGSRGASGRGSRGSAGARGLGAGAVAAAGRGGKDKKRSGEDSDLFDDGQDWLDDEAQPGLID